MPEGRRLAVLWTEAQRCQKIKVQKIDIGKLEFPMVRGWASGSPFIIVTGRSNMSESQPCEVDPSDTFDHMPVDLAALSIVGGVDFV